MKDKVFADSNVLLYLLSTDERKKAIAKTILKSNPVISAQVVSENVNVLIKKFPQLTLSQVAEHIKMLSSYCTVVPVSIATIEKAIELKQKYKFQWYDNTILAAAIQQECTILYSEDMHHNQLIDEKMRIINPFLTGA